jgi:malonyl-CoA O-methyltransferase
MTIVKNIDNKIRRLFSDAAIQYDVLTSLHKEIGRELVKKVATIEPCQTVLDIGMGTGWLTNKLTHFFPGSTIVGLDFAEGMIEAAKNENEGFQIIQAHALQLPFKVQSMDLIVSNLAFQWVSDLPHLFKQCQQALKSKGALSFTMFGHDTMQELFVALEQTKRQKQALPIQRLYRRQEVQKALEQIGFDHVSVDYERIKVRFPDMMALLKWVKGIGANGLKKDVYIGKDWLERARDYYDGHYKDRFGIYTTFEVIWVDANVK